MIPTHMYSSTSSSSQGSMGLASSGSGGDGGGLMRYGSAPSSLLASSVDSVVGVAREFSGHSHLSATGRIQTESVSHPSREEPPPPSKANTTTGLQRAYGFGVVGGDGSSIGASPSLVRHSSTPAGFLNQMAAAVGDSGGFSVTRGMGNYNSENLPRLNSQLSFTRQESTLSYISEEKESDDGDEMRARNGQRKTTHSYGSVSGFGMGTSTWDETNSVMYSVAPNKRPNMVGGGDLVGGLDSMENQFQFSMGQGGVEMTQIEKLMNDIPQDSVSCKIRAKRGCATHPRSIAERERRKRISGKLKKLQVLVPNMDKQTSYADMLDLAVQHIKSLQNHVQKLHHELDNCTCGCKTQDL